MNTTKKDKRDLDPIWIKFPDLHELVRMLNPVETHAPAYSYETVRFHRQHRVLPTPRFRVMTASILRIPERDLFNLED